MNKIEFSKNFKAFSNLIKARLFKKRIPLSVILSVTKRCNQGCNYCNIWKNDEGEMTTEQILRLIDELAELGTYRINLFGGEPLLREDIGVLIKHGKERGISMTLDTNGSLVLKKIGEIKNLDSILISLDGPEEIHDKQRGKGSYKKVMGAIKAVKSMNLPLTTLTVLTRYNLKCIDFILENAEKFGYLARFTHLMQTPETDNRVKDLIPSKQAYQATIRKIIMYKEKGRPVANTFEGLSYMYNWPINTRPYKCWAGLLHLSIEPNGDVYPCMSIRQHKKPLNCTNMSLKNIITQLSIDQNNCDFCLCSGLIEHNMVFSLNPKIILEVLSLRNYQKCDVK